MKIILPNVFNIIIIINLFSPNTMRFKILNNNFNFFSKTINYYDDIDISRHNNKFLSFKIRPYMSSNISEEKMSQIKFHHPEPPIGMLETSSIKKNISLPKINLKIIIIIFLKVN